MKKNHLPKRLISGVLAALLTALPAAAFSDTEGHWAEGAIAKWSEEYKLIQGYEDGTFRPDQSITRGAFAGIMDRFLKFRTASAPETFSDTAGTYWESSILKLHAAGVYQGNGGKALSGDSITRQQAVTMIARAFRITGDDAAALPYGDGDLVADYARGAVAEMSDRGYITDSWNGDFRPTDAITRAEIVNILSNMIQLLVQETRSYSGNADGTVMINAEGGASLSNMKIPGDLILAPGVTGAVTLTDVTIAGSIKNFSDVQPSVISTGQTPEAPVLPVDPEMPSLPAIQPSEVYTPGTKTGETVAYGSTQVPLYAERERIRLSSGDFYWDGDRLSYAGEDFRVRFGIDVSAYQNRASSNETIDWNAVANDGVEFAMVRAGLRGYSNGSLLSDAFYKQNIQGAMDAGIETGVYFFAQAITVEEAIEEADYVIELLKDCKIDGPVAYDWEMHDATYRVYGTTPEMATACAIAFCQRIAEAGYTPMIYAGSYVSYIKYDQGAIAPYLSWYPEYKSATSEKLFPTFAYQMDYWQFSSSCSIDGIGGRVDANLQFIS
ncbi:S-layer homology domain-containing protein [Oscillibacter sp.]|uniref:S-layer homology domain-containing protein n=1 Tax=Oscillibacter sp. TaxID=1945593 RepID=UPI0026391317|nr:S-layer homology domain-containing protein [Oscillibacter sp.]MDD3346243.1 S-layer homology domain-containing protein [Oscillibacter sp.]